MDRRLSHVPWCAKVLSHDITVTDWGWSHAMCWQLTCRGTPRPGRRTPSAAAPWAAASWWAPAGSSQRRRPRCPAARRTSGTASSQHCCCWEGINIVKVMSELERIWTLYLCWAMAEVLVVALPALVAWLWLWLWPLDTPLLLETISVDKNTFFHAPSKLRSCKIMEIFSQYAMHGLEAWAFSHKNLLEVVRILVR